MASLSDAALDKEEYRLQGHSKPRSVTQDKGNIEDTEIQEITETANARDIEGRQDEEPRVIPFIKGTTYHVFHSLMMMT